MCPLSMEDQHREIQPVDNNGSEWPVTAVLHVIALTHNVIVHGRTCAAVGVNFRWTSTPDSAHARSYRNILTDEPVQMREHADGTGFSAAEVFQCLPVALLVND
jgi:maltooligosyltrehalose synthase